MPAEPTVDVFTVVLSLRLMDMAKICESLAVNCAEKKQDKLARRFKRAVASFKEMLKEIENDAKQGKMF